MIRQTGKAIWHLTKLFITYPLYWYHKKLHKHHTRKITIRNDKHHILANYHLFRMEDNTLWVFR